MLKYGDGFVQYNPNYPCHTVLPNRLAKENKTEEEIIRLALEKPFNSEPLNARRLAGKKVCVIISDITRSWQRIHIFLPFVLEELHEGGAEAKDITLLFALGSHRPQTKEEQIEILGNDIYSNYKCVEHDCMASESMSYVGTTSRGVPVHVNTLAVEADFLVICGGIVFHDMAGFGGGRKSIVPGISSHETIMLNHSYSMKQDGKGIHPEARQNNRVTNPLSLDMEEAADFVKPDFLFNVIVDDEKIIAAFAGDYKKAFDVGCRALEEQFYVEIPRKFDFVIASAGGFPCDINFYQGTKALSNASYAVKPGGTIILLCEAREGLGHPEMDEFYEKFDNIDDMEEYLRSNFTVARFISFLAATDAARFNVIVVACEEFPLLSKHGIRVFTDFSEALASVSLPQDAEICLMPDAAKTLPYIKGC